MVLRSLNSLVKKCIYGATLTGTLLSVYPTFCQDTYTPQQRKEQEFMSGVAGFLGALTQSGAIPARTPKDARIMSGLGAGLSAFSQSQNAALLNESIRYSGAASAPQVNVYNGPNQVPYQNQSTPAQPVYQNPRVLVPQLEPTIFICNYIKDFNNNGDFEPDEFVGFRKDCYRANESVTLGVFLPKSTPHIGTKLEFRVYSPRGDVVASGEYDFRFDANEVSFTKTNVIDILRKSGPGNYRGVFLLNGHYFGFKDFHTHEN